MVQQDGRPARTGAALRESLAAFIAMRAKIKTSVTKVIAAGDDLAVLYNDWTLSASVSDGNPMTLSGKAVEVERRRADGTWMFVVDDPFGRN